jgi:hypothetical protein
MKALLVLADDPDRAAEPQRSGHPVRLHGWAYGIAVSHRSRLPQGRAPDLRGDLIRSALRFVGWGDRKLVSAALRPVYHAESAAELALEDAARQLDARYPNNGHLRWASFRGARPTRPPPSPVGCDHFPQCASTAHHATPPTPNIRVYPVRRLSPSSAAARCHLRLALPLTLSSDFAAAEYTPTHWECPL